MMLIAIQRGQLLRFCSNEDPQITAVFESNQNGLYAYTIFPKTSSDRKFNSSYQAVIAT